MSLIGTLLRSPRSTILDALGVEADKRKSGGSKTTHRLAVLPDVLPVRELLSLPPDPERTFKPSGRHLRGGAPCTQFVGCHFYLIAPIFFRAVERLIGSNERLIGLRIARNHGGNTNADRHRDGFSVLNKRGLGHDVTSRSADFRAAAKSEPGRMTANSSPPTRAVMSMLQTPCA